MLVVRTQQAGVVQAVETTFSGQKPCRMCSAIETGMKEDRENAPVAPTLKKTQETQLLAMEQCEAPARIAAEKAEWPDFIVAESWRAEAPPTPPPLA